MERIYFERDERYTATGEPELDWRPARAILPRGSAPVAIVVGPGNYCLLEAQWFSEDEVRAYILSTTGYTHLQEPA